MSTLSRQLTASDFPRGFAETGDGKTFKPIMFDIPYGDYFDAGIKYYGEFFANLEYAWELLHGGMVKVDGQPGKVSVVARFENAIQLKWRPDAA